MIGRLHDCPICRRRSLEERPLLARRECRVCGAYLRDEERRLLSTDEQLGRMAERAMQVESVRPDKPAPLAPPPKWLLPQREP